MSVRPSQSITATFPTQSSAGAAANADSLPTGTLYVNGTANGATVTVTNVTTGLYKFAMTLPSGLAVGDIAEVWIAATIGGTAAKALVWRDRYDANAILDELTSAHATAGTVGEALGLISDVNEAVAEVGADVHGLSGPGADTVTITLYANSPTNTIPLADADVWITSDLAGSNVVAGTLQTNDSGEAVFLLDAGETYYLWAQKSGSNSIQGQSFVAAAD